MNIVFYILLIECLSCDWVADNINQLLNLTVYTKHEWHDSNLELFGKNWKKYYHKIIKSIDVWGISAIVKYHFTLTKVFINISLYFLLNKKLNSNIVLILNLITYVQFLNRQPSNLLTLSEYYN